MESFSKTLDGYTGSFVAKRRRKRLSILLAIVAVLTVAGIVVARLSSGGYFDVGSGKAVPKSAVLERWQARDWDGVLASCAASLATKPLDPFYLGFKGLASFYKGLELPEGEERAALMDESVVNIRKALVPEGRAARGLPRAELEYVLGKAYYQKGSAYLDGAVKWLEASIANGYVGSDSREYLAVAYAGLGQSEAAVRNFEAALQRRRSDFLLVAAAKAYMAANRPDRAESLLLEALSASQDALAREKCRFGLADLYEARGDDSRAAEQLEFALKDDSMSAEAHYRLGLLAQKRGDNLAARASWRRAVAIDPMHMPSRQKLAEKL
ncbi:MAG: hypothetical protein JNG85_12395 [Spirochaetaceae bacterium]|nr:hypothetical protein [Spirochaetaceae bacterium]